MGSYLHPQHIALQTFRGTPRQSILERFESLVAAVMQPLPTCLLLLRFQFSDKCREKGQMVGRTQSRLVALIGRKPREMTE
jgi:hypothetical protein